MIQLLCIIMLVLSSSLASARDLGLIYKNNSAVGKIKDERMTEAYSEFVGLLAQSPFDPALQFNVGSSLALMGEVEKSEKLYKQLLIQVDELLKTSSDAESLKELAQLRFGILYNLGVYYQSKQETDLALENYQLALELVPDSKEIKTNIEMMFKNGGGKGKGKSKDKSDKQDEKSGDDKNDDQSEGDNPQDDKDKKDNKPKDDKDKDQQNKQPKQFDQKQMSMENLQRIMEELKQQEQSIRAKVQGKGGKDAKKEKDW